MASERSYVSSILQPGERVLSVGRLHWIIYMGAVIIFLFSIGFLWAAQQISAEAATTILGSHFGARKITYEDLRFFSQIAYVTRIVGLIILAMSVLHAGKAWFDQWITEIAVTNRRVIYKRGFIKRHTVEMNMDKIESVTVTQSILGRTLDYGTIHIRGTGEGIEHLHKIASPISLRNCITVH